MMGIPQIIYLILIGIGLGASLVNHGQPKKGNDSFFITLLSSGVSIGLMIWGGFFHA